MNRALSLLASLALATATWAASASTAASTASLRVVNENNQPVANATILLGYEPGNPFSGNVLKTAADGSAGIPTDWKAALPVTVQAPGYITSTVPVLTPGEHLLTIIAQESANQIEIKGTATDFGRLIKDGKVDFAMVIPAMTRESMLAFDIASVISPQNDTIEIIGNSVDIPSNITLPNQEESYIFPITLDKPDYRVYVREPGAYKMYAMHGQFPLQRVVDDIRGGKSMFEVINHFTFKQSGQRNINVSGNMRNVNLPVNQTPFNATTSVKAPAFPADKVMISLNLSAENDTLFMPTDMKRLTPNQTMALKTNASLGTGHVLSLLLDAPKTTPVSEEDAAAELQRSLNPLNRFIDALPMKEAGQPVVKAKATYDFNKMTFTFQPASGTVTPAFLPMIAAPQIVNNVMKLQMPTLPNGLTGIATYMVLSEIEELGTGSVKSERRTRMWEIWNAGFIQQMEMPRVTFTKRPDRKYRWEVMFLARPSNFVFADAPGSRVDLSTVTHVTRNALQL